MVLLFSLITMFSIGQEFLGIKVDGTKSEVIAKFTAKGFKVRPGSTNDNVTPMVGKISGVPYEVNIVSTPTSKTVWKFAVYLPEQSTWYSLKSTYQQYLTTLTEKYGEPSDSYAFFKNPYYEGDGYEMSAVQLEKCYYQAYWSNGVWMEISKWKQVKINYENPTNSELDTQEKEKLNKTIF